MLVSQRQNQTVNVSGLIRDFTGTRRGLLGDVPIPSTEISTTSIIASSTIGCRHAQGRIVENLKYNLQQYKYRGQKDVYKSLYEAAMVGPEVVRPAEAEDVLGLNHSVISKCMTKRSQFGEY